MGLFKEHVVAFETIAKKQTQIYNDACDYGYPYKEKNPPSEVKELINFIKDLKGSSLIHKRTPYRNGVEIKIRIGWEIDERMEIGSQYTIAFNRHMNSYSSLHKDCDCFISVHHEKYSTPVLCLQ